ncbi:uncharacterized protein [Amphiura filiformis]|uniref:uncharacterized protein n=1 Tax=Amphiura filiformis TaxID=82378 RepID=UPI003B20CEBB
MCATKGRGPQTVFSPAFAEGSGLQVQGNRIPGMPAIAMQNASGNTYRRKKSKWRGPVPVSAIEKVLTQDNRYADMMLTKQLRRIQNDRHHAEKLFEWQQQSFVVRQAMKETELREMGVSHTSFLPEMTMKVSEPDVRARRPFGRVSRRYADQIREITAADRSVTLPEIALAERRDEMGLKHRVYRRERTDTFTRLHGFDLPLYGPEQDAKKEQRKREIVKSRQRAQESKGLNDARFVELERTLTRNGRKFPEAVWRYEKNKPSGTAEDKADEGLSKKAPKSAEILRKLQEQMTSKPMSELAKSALVDFDI